MWRSGVIGVCPLVRYLHYYLSQRTYCSYRYLRTYNFAVSFTRIKRISHQYCCKFNFSCWHCNTEYEPFKYFCPNCTKIQKPSNSVTYFELFNLSKSFDVNLEQMREQFRTIQSLLHPDKFNLKGEHEQNLSAEYSSLVNKAYSSLSNPLTRAVYMLQLKGIEIDEDKTEMDKMFLMEIMELNEEIDVADSGKLIKIEEQNNIRLSKFYSELSVAFSTDDMNKAKDLVMKIKYFVSIENRIKDIKLKALDK